MTVVTPTLPERSQLLDRCKRSVAAQNAVDLIVAHRILVDSDRRGPQTLRNEIIRASDTEWILPLDDDDELDPDCVATLLAHSDGADIVYPWCRMAGRTDGWVPNKLFNADGLFKQNFIPVTALIRRDSLLMLGGYQQVPMEDWALWQWAYLHGLRFRCVPEVLWTYHHGEHQHYQREAA